MSFDFGTHTGWQGWIKKGVTACEKELNKLREERDKFRDKFGISAGEFPKRAQLEDVQIALHHLTTGR